MDFMGVNISPEIMEQWLFEYGLSVLAAVTILTLGWLGAKTIRRVAANLMLRAHLDKTLVSFVSNVLYVLVLAFVVIATLNKLGVQTASLVAIIGAAGLAVGLALQGSLSNFAAGLMIILFRHFRIGDFIQGAGVTGTVADMNIFTTTLNTATNEKVIIPNNSLTSSPLTNFSGNRNRRIDLIIGVGYDDNLSDARAALKRAVDADKRILGNPAPFIGVDVLGDSSVGIAVRVWAKREELGDVRSDLLQAIKEECDRSGISIPYPQRDLHMITPPDAPAPKKKKAA